MRGAGPRWPRGIAAQIVILVICVAVGFQVVTAAIFTILSSRFETERPPQLGASHPLAVADRFAEFAQLFDRLPTDARPGVVDAMRTAELGLLLRALSAREIADRELDAQIASRSANETDLVNHLRRTFGAESKLTVLPGPQNIPKPRQQVVAVAVRDGSGVEAILPSIDGMRGPNPIFPIFVTLSLVGSMLIAFLWWVTRAITKPLARFARAAESFSVTQDPPPLIEDNGPDEVRAASRALNQMRMRVRNLVENRTRMLAAVGHDLRTPITRLRLRAEFISEDETRSQMLGDLQQMDRMVHTALSYLRDGPDMRQQELMDIASLLQTICDDWTDLGGNVVYDGPAHLLVRGNGDDLQRAITNLVDNALKHGGDKATVALRSKPGSEIVVDVLDAGSGISGHLKQEMLQPFARGDTARSMDGSSGFGLGLTIAAELAEAHGGQLTLLDNHPSGVIARLTLPIPDSPGAC
jgi:signal transduction histidine kinase